MKFSVSIIAAILAFFIVAGVLHARVVHSGVVTVVLPEQHMIIIDQQRYNVLADARIYRDSDPEERPLSLVDLRSGQRVVFDPIYIEGQTPKLNVIVILDRE